ncbi:MAG: aldehyde dehydrogenase family protein [Actinomycetota bacterium]
MTPETMTPETMTPETMTPETMTPIADIPQIVERARSGFRSGLLTTVDRRREVLESLRQMLVEQEDRFAAALRTDLGKSAIEAYSTEVGFTIGEIDHALSNLDAWTKPTKVRVELSLKPARARIVPEPLGTVCIIAPWNYPLQLLLAPVVPAIAAGNTAVVKPSEMTPNVARVIEETLPAYVDERIVGIVNGGVPETTALLEERFDHIFYTGNGRVGRIVMKAAAEHLTPVTLELGGKSPVIVAADADIRVAARRIAWGKFLNSGQTCVAPDHVLVDATVERELVDAMAEAVTEMYGADPRTSEDYSRLVSTDHLERLTGLLDAGGFQETVTGGTSDSASRYMAPTIVRGVDRDAALMQEEIFGPILPVIAVSDVDEAIKIVTDGDKPLALYVFSSSDETVEQVVSETSAGGVLVNHTMLHLAVADLPFGGVGESGMGAYHGKAGFDTFTHAKPVLEKPTKLDPPVLYPPYTKMKQRLIRKFL